MSENHNSEKKGTQKNQYDSPNYKNCGRKSDQKMKAFVLFSLFWKHTDENHVLSARYLNDLLNNYLIPSERRSIYRDIKDINKTLLAFEKDTFIPFAEEDLEKDDSNELKFIVYDPRRKGYYLQRRPLEFAEIQILAQCICAAKFITADQSERLFNSICKFISEYQEDELWETSFLFEKEKTDKPEVFFNIPVINDAMSTFLNGNPHIPEKVEFDYSEYVIDEMSLRPVLKNTNRKIVSPYKFLTLDGNIHLFGYDDFQNQMQAYRIDFISKVLLTGIPRTGQEVYEKINLQEYVRSRFSVQGNMQSHISILIEKTHLDTAIQRFGTNGARYTTVDALHFMVDANIEINPSFYNWLLGFGTAARILKPEWAAEAFLKHIDKIKNSYNNKQ